MIALAIIVLIILFAAWIVGLAYTSDSPGEFFAALGLILAAGAFVALAEWALRTVAGGH